MTDSQLEWVLVFILVIGIIVLAALFGLGKVEEKTSYGLPELLESLKMATGMILGFKFGKQLIQK